MTIDLTDPPAVADLRDGFALRIDLFLERRSPCLVLRAGDFCELRLDEGAANALRAGSSLLPVGVIQVIGNFRRGDVVTLVDGTGRELGRGLAEYSDEEAQALVGCRSENIEERLGYRGRSVMVHRDDLVLFDDER